MESNNTRILRVRFAVVVLIITPLLLSFICNCYVHTSYNLMPISPQVSWVQFMLPGLWIDFICKVLLTSTNLFILLNLLILSIFALAHLHGRSACKPPGRSSSLPSVGVDIEDSIDDHYVRIHPGSHPLSQNYAPHPHALHHSVSESQLNDDDHVLHIQKVKLEESIATSESAADYDIALVHYLKTRDDGKLDDEAMADAKALAAGSQLMNRGVSKSVIAQVMLQSAASQEVLYMSCNSDDDEEKRAGMYNTIGTVVLGAEADADDETQAFNGEERFAAAAAASRRVDAHLHKSRPLASAHFTRRKLAAASANDRALSPLRISKPNNNNNNNSMKLRGGDTIDAIWSAICESKRHSTPLNSQSHSIQHAANEGPHCHHAHHVRKSRGHSPIKQRSSKTRRNTDQNHHTPAAVARSHIRRRDSFVPQEELNAQADSFISRFNAQIKIQREKSLLDFMEMVGRGSN